MSDLLERVLADLAAEAAVLDDLVSPLAEPEWRRPTPAPGWDIATQIAHLAWTDEAAVKAATDKPAWDALVLEAMADPTHAVDHAALAGGAVEPAELLARWRAGRTTLADALRGLEVDAKIPWFGPPMSASSMATARFMETWAHSLDVHQALAVDLGLTDRIKHVAHLGVRTRRFAFAAHGLTAPDLAPYVELRAPSGDVWRWGEESGQRVTGSALDFCLLVTQRIHRTDTDLVAVGADAERWLGIAQCFAGPPGEGRPPRA